MGNILYDHVRSFDFQTVGSEEQDQYLEILTAANPDGRIAEIWDIDDQLTLSLHKRGERALRGAMVLDTDQYPVLWINRLAVAPDTRGQGLGGVALRFAEFYAINEGFNELHLKTWPENEVAIRLYEGAGLEVVEEDYVHISMAKAVG